MKSEFIGIFAAVAPMALGLPGSGSAAVEARDLFQRQSWSCCEGACATVPGDPANEQDEAMHIQVSETIDCGGGGTGCSVTELNSHTITWHVDAGVNAPFASLGGGVSESTTTGNSYTCSSGKESKVCVWAKVAHVSYDVIKAPAIKDVCDVQPDGPYRITAPTGDISYYCVHGDACQVDGFSYWE